jgi:hypothetical protein
MQGNIADEMKRLGLLPFTIKSGERPEEIVEQSEEIVEQSEEIVEQSEEIVEQPEEIVEQVEGAAEQLEEITLTNDCGLHVLFRMDHALLQSWPDPARREKALRQLQTDLKKAIGELAKERDRGNPVTAGGITDALLAKLFVIRKIDEAPFCGVQHASQVSQQGDPRSFNDAVKDQLQTGHRAGTSFALLVGDQHKYLKDELGNLVKDQKGDYVKDQSRNRIDIGGYKVGQGHFVTLIPARHPADDLDQTHSANPNEQLWILSDSLRPDEEILVTTQQIEEALPESDGLHESYDLISARNATVSLTDFESLIPDLRERIMRRAAEMTSQSQDHEETANVVEADASTATGKRPVDPTGAHRLDPLMEESKEGQLPKQGEIAAAMKRIHMLPFLVEARGRREKVTLTNDCGLHVLFRLDHRLLQSWPDETERAGALMQLQKDLRSALQQQAEEGDIPGNRAGNNLTDGWITNSLLAKLFKIRGIDDNLFTATRDGLPDAPGPFEALDDEVRNPLEKGYEEGISFALSVGDRPGDQVTIAGHVVGQGHFVTLIPARHPQDGLAQPAFPNPGEQLWILSDSLDPGGEILVTTQQVKEALPDRSADPDKSYDLISARNATVRHTHFESLIPGLRDANLSADDQILAPEAELDKVEEFLQLSPFKAQSAAPLSEWSEQLDRQKDHFLTQRFFNENLDQIAAINDKRPFREVSEPAALADLGRKWRMRRSAALPEWPKNDLTSLAAILDQRLNASLAQREELRQDFVNKIPSHKKEAGAAPSQETLRQWLTNEANYAVQIPFMESTLKAQAAWLEEKIALKLAACLPAESEKALGHGKVPPERVTQVLLDLDKSLERDMLMFNEAVRLQARLKTLGAAIVAGKGVNNVEWARAIAAFDALQSGSIPVRAEHPPLRANTYKQIAKHLLTPSAKLSERQKAPGETEITQAIRPLKELDHLKPRLSDEIRETLARKINETNKTEAKAAPASIVENRVADLPSFSGSVIHATRDYVFILVEAKKKQSAVVVATAAELGIEGLQQGSHVTYPPKRVAAKKRTQGK